VKKLVEVARLFPPETVAERTAAWDRFWQGENPGRPMILARSSQSRYTRNVAPETAARNFAATLEIESKVPYDNLPYFDCDMYPVALASAFGGRVTIREHSNWIEPVVHKPEDVYRLEPPDVLAGLVGEGVRKYQYVLERLDGYVPPRVPDMQGPLMTAAMLWKEEDFILAMYDEPDAVHHLLDLVTNHITAVHQYFRETFPGAVSVNCPLTHMPQELGVGLIQDFAHLLSPDLYAEFGLPYVNRIADRFGGVLVHCCGVFEQHWPVVARIHNLRGLDTQYPYCNTERVTAAFPDSVHSVTLDYAEYTRNFATGDPDAFLKFLIARVPRSVRWQLWADADDLPGIERQVALIQAAWQ